MLVIEYQVFILCYILAYIAASRELSTLLNR